MVKKKIRLRGLKEVQRNLKKVGRVSERNLKHAMTEVVVDVQRYAMTRTPIDTGNLRSSFKNKVEKTSKGYRGKIWNESSYALFVHEAPPSTHFKSPWPRGRKFLERGITDNLRAIKETIIKWLKI